MTDSTAPAGATALRSSQAAIDLIVAEEVSSQATYQKLYQHPTWPGGASGVTIGIGFDCGYSSATDIWTAWGDLLPTPMVDALAACAGITGSPAHSHASMLRGVVTVPWDAAMAVFLKRDMPKWEAIVQKALPNTDKLAPDSFGALVSLAYNRGAAGFNQGGDRDREMHTIRQMMALRMFEQIPDEFRSMKRLWPNVLGLRLRRDHEAALFERGLDVPSAAVPPAPSELDAQGLQRSLNELGATPQIAVDGVLGPETENAVKAFQTAKGLDVDGIAGPLTTAAIQSALSGAA